MKTASLELLGFGLVLALAASACKVTTDDTGDEEGGSSSTGGTSTTGGNKTTGGSSTTTGGTSSTGGTAAKGGAASTGGTSTTMGGAPVAVCDVTGGKGSTPADGCVFEPADLAGPVGKCLTCISKTSTCCIQVADCYGDNPFNQCGYGGPTPEETEFLCYQDCLIGKAMAGGGFYDEDRDPAICAGMCATPKCGAIGDATNELIACMHKNCEDECFVP